MMLVQCRICQERLGTKSLLPQSLVWLLGFGANHSLLFIVKYWHHHIETRQIHFTINQLNNNPKIKLLCLHLAPMGMACQRTSQNGKSPTESSFGSQKVYISEKHIIHFKILPPGFDPRSLDTAFHELTDMLANYTQCPTSFCQFFIFDATQI